MIILQSGNNKISYKDLRDTSFGKSLTNLSEVSALDILFDFDGNLNNKTIISQCSKNHIFSFISLSSSLTFLVNNTMYTLEPRYPHDEENTIELLHDIQSTIEDSLINTHFHLVA